MKAQTTSTPEVTTLVKLVHMEANEEFRLQLEEEVMQMFSGLGKHGAIDITILCMVDAPRAEVHGPRYECHGMVRLSWLNKDLFIRMRGGDCESLVIECGHKLKKLALRQSRRQRTKRYHYDPRHFDSLA